MSSFDERAKSFEKKFAHDEELQFKVNARKNKYLGQWASQILGYNYNTGEWFEQSYKIFNKDYNIKRNFEKKAKTKKETNLFKKIIEMIK